MRIQSTFQLKSQYGIVSCVGTYSSVALLDVFDRALGVGEDAGIRGVVVDIREVHLDGPPPGTMERFYLGETAAKIQREHETLVVLAVVGSLPLIDPGRFAETVALNRGAQGKVFESMAEAIDWVDARTHTGDHDS